MGEFFVLAKFQNKGVGRQIAKQVFQQFPGHWEVRQLPKNTKAIIFWEKVISEFTGGNFSKDQITVNDPESSVRNVIYFDSTEHR